VDKKNLGRIEVESADWGKVGSDIGMRCVEQIREEVPGIYCETEATQNNHAGYSAEPRELRSDYRYQQGGSEDTHHQRPKQGDVVTAREDHQRAQECEHGK